MQLGHTSRRRPSDVHAGSLAPYTSCVSASTPRILLGSRRVREGIFNEFTSTIAGAGQEATATHVAAVRNERQAAAASVTAAAAAAAAPTETAATTPSTAAPAFAQVAGLGGTSAPVAGATPAEFDRSAPAKNE